MARQSVWALQDLPCFWEWFLDWTTPLPKHGRRLEVPQREIGSRPTAGAATPTAPTTIGSAKSSSNPRSGRPRSAETAAVYQFCYESYGGAKRSIIRRRAAEVFGVPRAPKDDAAVTIYARRYAEDNNLPWPVPTAQENA
jgi:hypothetical protein